MIAYAGSVDFAVKFGLRAYPFGYLCLTLLVLVIAYNVGRHRFLNINLTLKKVTLAVLVYSFLISFLTPICVAVAHRLIGPMSIVHTLLLLAVIGLAGGVLSTGPILYAMLTRNAFWLKSNVTTGLAHELKSPIGAITGAVDIVLDRNHGTNTLPPATVDYLNMIRANSLRLEAYVGDLLQIARGPADAIHMRCRSVVLGQLIRETIEPYRPVMDKKNLTLQLDIPSGMMASVDLEKMAQVVSNVMSNAVKFSSDGVVTVHLRRHDERIVCQVTDKGMGVAPHDLARIFDRFYQGSQSKQGSGIGLTIAKTWIEAHHGKIWADSDGEGKGTRVTFTVAVNR